MSVRHSLLAILDQGPCYGYQLRAEFDRRTGTTWPLNVGQIYNTLERLERDGCVARDGADSQGHVYWRITPVGASEVATWLSASVPRDQPARDEVAIKVALAATLPGADVHGVVAAQRAESERRHEQLIAPSTPTDAAGLAATLITEALRAQLAAELAWLDRAEALIAAHPPAERTAPLTEERPKRGRPARQESDSQPAATGKP